ncbi:MAG: carbon monoxide dehydrogenase [Nitrospirae bacterium]|nr:carbon monoxide dehydrogenase [Nitrospirota bacterium]
MSDYGKSGYKSAEQIIQWGKSYCDWVETCFDRAEKLKPCPTGARGACCKHCHMGPCRFVHSSEERVEKGVCGATLGTVASRNFLRMATAGAAAHADQARDMAFTLLGVANGEIKDYGISHVKKLQKIAEVLDIKFEGRAMNDVAGDVAESLINDFGRQKGVLSYIKRAPQKTRERWEEWGISPRGIDREITEAIFRTNVGVDHDPESLLLDALRVSLADGWGSSMISTDIADILFGALQPVKTDSGFGIFKEDEVNLIVIGHEPTIAKALSDAASESDMIEYAKSKGANGINLGSIYGSRLGISSAGGFTNHELCIMTGLIDAITVDSECTMPTLVEVANSFHTKIITTSKKAHLPGALHIQFDVHRAKETAREMVMIAIDNYQNRTGTGEKVTEKNSMIEGFPQEYIEGGVPEGALRLLNDAIRKGKIRGVAGLVGYDNPRVQATGIHQYIARELIGDDVLVLSSGCASAACGVSGYLNPDTALEKAGLGLREACREIGIPPILHLGSYVDSARILTIISGMADEGHLSDEIGGMPLVIVAPEWFAEKEITLGCYFAASGVPVILGGTSPVEASEEVMQIMTERWFERFKGSLSFEPDFEKMHTLALDHIDKAREELKLRKYEYGKCDD